MFRSRPHAWWRAYHPCVWACALGLLGVWPPGVGCSRPRWPRPRCGGEASLCVCEPAASYVLNLRARSRSLDFCRLPARACSEAVSWASWLNIFKRGNSAKNSTEDK
uniref:Putative secreted protein n=1 Tax=Ixodes ricinus TaxID=34613 RepID=A0A6B0U9L7_IXORI